MTEPSHSAFYAKHDVTSNSERNNVSSNYNSRSQNVGPPTATIDLKSLASENQSIKLIPSVEEIFRSNGVDFDSSLDDGTRSWLQKLQHSWNLWKKNGHTISLLHNFYETSEDPFSSVLILVINCQGFSDCKPNTLPYQIVDQLKIWSHKKSEISYLLTSNLKFTAFNIAKEQKNFSFVKLIVETYQIAEEKEHFLPYVRGMLNRSCYKSAYQSILALNLQKHIAIEDLLVPLILQDKTNLVDDYLSTCPEQATALVQFLDNLLDRSESVKTKIYSFLANRNVPDLNWSKLYHKPIGKLIARLCNTYNVPLNTCEHLSRNRAIGGIRFLIHQKYQENIISDNAWNDLVIDTLSDKPDLVEELVNLVNDYDTKEASKWAKYFNLPIELYPENITNFLKSQNDACESESWETSPCTSQDTKYHLLSLPGDKIIFIDTPEAFKDAVYNGLVGESLVGLDSEWKPSFGAKQSTVSLIQISTKSNVFLFDVLALSDLQYASLWTILAENIFDNNNVVKLGFGLENDMHEIRASVPGLSCVKYKGLNYLELSNLWKALLNAGLQMPHKKLNTGEGLSSIVEQCFGMALRKHEQCSNWENRPLRGSQLEYAALDAYVLLEIYYIFEKISVNANISFEDVCYQVMAESEQSKIKKPRRKQSRDKTKYNNYLQGPNANPITVENIKLLLENTLVMLASYLRCCGIDTIVSAENVKWENCVQTASRENRYMVIQSAQHKKVSKEIPRSHVYTLQSCKLEEQIKEIFVYFNMRLQPDKIYGRCQICNSNEIVLISAQIMRKMINCNKTDKSNINELHKFESRNLNETSANLSCDNQFAMITPSQHWTETCATASTSAAFDEDYGNFSDNEEQEDILIPVIDKNCVLPPEQIFSEKCLTSYGVPIQLQTVLDDVINNNEHFHICQVCGKCYWKNGYLPEFLNNLIIKLCQTI